MKDKLDTGDPCGGFSTENSMSLKFQLQHECCDWVSGDACSVIDRPAYETRALGESENSIFSITPRIWVSVASNR